jgi:hypothetical protein
MPKNYKNKYCKPKDPDIANINPTYRLNRIFMHNISRKFSNQQIFEYSKKHKNLKEQRKIQRRSWNEKRCVENDRISGEICETNTQHDMTNQ